MMKRLSRHIIPVFTAIILAACTDELPVEKSPQQYLLDGDYYFVLVDDNEPTSRLQYDGILHTEFTTGDRIGIFAPQNADKSQIPNDVFTARDMTSDPPSGPRQVLVPCDDEIKKEVPENEPEYLLYYPYMATQSLDGLSDGDMKFTVKEDQKEEANLKASDLLWCHKMLTDEEMAADFVTVNMNHAMANIIIKVAKDSLDTGHDVVLPSMATEATGIRLRYTDREMTPELMEYSVRADSKKDVTMYRMPDDTDEYNYVYRAIVPACQTIAKDTDIFTLHIKNKTGEYEPVTYKLAQDVTFRPGKYYTFNLRSGQKPAIPDVTDDDSWVLDVVDPETGTLVGLLCREYIRYQPEIGLTDVENITGTPISETSKYISSQAWVFYNLKKGYESEGIIDLDHGTIVRFIYDLRVGAQYPVQNHQLASPKWPAPHINFRGSGGYVLVDHGHTWDNGVWGDLTPGTSSALYQWKGNEYVTDGHNDPETGELYMHGGTIEWSQTSGTHPVNSGENLDFFHISSFTMPTAKTTTEKARLDGHIAIDGEKVYVSYESFDQVTKRELSNPSVKVGKPVPHFMHDVRGSEIIDYPIVKIGYNNFWMTKSLRSAYNADGTKLAYLYPEIDETNSTTEYYETVFQPGYMYSKRGTYFDVNTEATEEEKKDFFPKLYNYVAFQEDKFLPDATDIDATGKNRFIVMFPTVANFGTMLNYFGTTFGGKLCSNKFYPQNSAGAYTVPDGKIGDALKNCEYTNYTNNVYVANISGFNLLPMGSFINNSFSTSFGEQFNLWVRDEIEEGIYTQYSITFNAWTPFATNVQLNQVFEVNTATVNDNSKNMLKTHRFLPVRFLMRMKHQQNTQDNTEVVKSIKSAITRQHKVKASADNESKMVNVGIVKSESEK